MAKIKLTKTAVDAATIGAKDYARRDTIVPGFLLKVTPGGRKIFMVHAGAPISHPRHPSTVHFCGAHAGDHRALSGSTSTS